MDSAAGGYVDTHVHLWDAGRHDHTWLDDEPGLPRIAGPDAYAAAVADDPPRAWLFMEAGTDHGFGRAESEWVAELCADQPGFAGMVVWGPVADGPEVLGHHLDALDGVPVRGVRQLIQWESPGFCLQHGFVAAVDTLADRHLPFDVCVFASQLGDVIELARRAPRTRLVLDHLAKPAIATDGFSAWRDRFETAADLPNVWCKLSGLVTEARHDDWTVDALRPYVDVALEAFGPERTVWGSDWPVVTNAATHKRWREATDELLADLGDAERGWVMADNAAEVYGLDVAVH